MDSTKLKREIFSIELRCESRASIFKSSRSNISSLDLDTLRYRLSNEDIDPGLSIQVADLFISSCKNHSSSISELEFLVEMLELVSKGSVNDRLILLERKCDRILLDKLEDIHTSQQLTNHLLETSCRFLSSVICETPRLFSKYSQNSYFPLFWFFISTSVSHLLDRSTPQKLILSPSQTMVLDSLSEAALNNSTARHLFASTADPSLRLLVTPIISILLSSGLVDAFEKEGLDILIAEWQTDPEHPIVPLLTEYFPHLLDS